MTVVVKNSAGSVVNTVIDKSYSKGKISASFAYGSLAVGSYNVVFTAKNSGGTSTVTKTFKVEKKPVAKTDTIRRKATAAKTDTIRRKR